MRASHQEFHRMVEELLIKLIISEESELRIQLNRLEKKIDEIRKDQMTQDELIAQLQSDSAQIIKIGTETRSLLDKVQALLDQIAAGEVKPELAAAAADVQSQLNIVDDLVPDAATP